MQLDFYLCVRFNGLLSHPNCGEHVPDSDKKFIVRLKRVDEVLEVVVVLQVVVTLDKLI
jgi:hypothetical protein